MEPKWEVSDKEGDFIQRAVGRHDGEGRGKQGEMSALESSLLMGIQELLGTAGGRGEACSRFDRDLSLFSHVTFTCTHDPVTPLMGTYISQGNLLTGP